jgi:hypothetical protein
MTPIFADAGVPMLFLHLPVILLALVPIILTEAYVAKRGLGLPFKRSLGPITVANFISMLLGFPLLWIVAVVIQMLTGGGRPYGLAHWWQKVYAVTVQAPWLIPYERDLYWMTPVAALVMLIPAFFLSVWIERLVLQAFWPDETKERLRLFSYRAHLASYAILVLMWLWYGGVLLQKAKILHP